MVDEMKEGMSDICSFSIEEGEIVTGTVSRIEKNQALIDVEGCEVGAILPISELSSLHVDEVGDVLSEGSEIKAKVLRWDKEEGKLILSKRMLDAEEAWDRLMAQYENGEFIKVRVAEVVKGGLVVDLGVRGFIPASLVERHFVEDFSDYKGRELTLKIIEIDPQNNKLILSAKAVQEEEATRKRKEVFETLKAGDVVEGTVQRLVDFGAFICLEDCVDGLCHISEICWSRVEHPSAVLKVGDQVKCKVLKIDPERERISLSIKETQEGPWDEASRKLREGDVVSGSVKRLVSFGAFVEVCPGVEGLVHISEMSDSHVVSPSAVLTEGQNVNVKILSVNVADRRISLTMRGVPNDLGSSLSYCEDGGEPSSCTIRDDHDRGHGKRGTGDRDEFPDEQDSGNRSNLNVTLGDMYPELRRLK
ncbi:30S ribosomal protein S1 [Pasteuria penetrans]|uniref:30S ribosomal protein S1 n=1 Tax=Pasteuria penetrans TaxID=86005 RepID=UPI000F98B42C